MSLGTEIARLRRNAGMTQQKLAETLGVSFQAVSSWEHDKYAPDIERLKDISAVFHTTPGRLLGLDAAASLTARERFFDEAHMHSFIRLGSRTAGMKLLNASLSFAEEAYKGKTLPGGSVPFINLPLSMCCHTLAMGLPETAAVSALLAFAPADMAQAKLPELPEEVTAALRLFSAARKDGVKKHKAELAASPAAALLVCLYSLHALTAGALSREDTLRLVTETDEDVLPLSRALKAGTDAENNAAWLLSFGLMSAVEFSRRFL